MWSHNLRRDSLQKDVYAMHMGIQWFDAWIDSAVAVDLRLDLLLRLTLAVLLGGAIGWEREASGKPAGLRTNILICLGATLLTDLSIQFSRLVTGTAVGDPARITAQIVSGIGFLGAGTILQARGTVTGLTTAATLWVVAAIGMSVGGGAYLEAVGATLLVLVVLIVLERIEKSIDARRGAHFRLVLAPVAGTGDAVETDILEMGLRIRRRRIEKDAKLRSVILHLWVTGAPEAVRTASGRLAVREDIDGFYSD